MPWPSETAAFWLLGFSTSAPANTLNRLSAPEAPSVRAKSNARSYYCAALVADELVALVQVRFAIAVLRPKL